MPSKGAYGRQRPAMQAAPVLVDDAPVVLPEGAHGPADPVRYSEFERGARTRIVVFPGPPAHSDWPFRPSAREMRERMSGRRPHVSPARQAPRSRQTGVRRTDVERRIPTAEVLEIVEGF